MFLESDDKRRLRLVKSLIRRAADMKERQHRAFIDNRSYECIYDPFKVDEFIGAAHDISYGLEADYEEIDAMMDWYKWKEEQIQEKFSLLPWPTGFDTKKKVDTNDILDIKTKTKNPNYSLEENFYAGRN